jgi:hypothetical protein
MVSHFNTIYIYSADTDICSISCSPCLRRWTSIQLEKLKQEEALALQWAREKVEVEEEQIRQDSGESQRLVLLAHQTLTE